MKNNKTARELPFDARLVDDIVESALFYGFKPIPEPDTKTIAPGYRKVASEPLFLDSEHEDFEPLGTSYKVSILRKFLEDESKPLGVPELWVHKTVAKKYTYYTLDIIGVQKAIAEALLLEVAVHILRASGISTPLIDINSVGDKESHSRFQKELVAYYKKHLQELSPEGRQQFKKDPFSVLTIRDPKTLKITDSAPKAINFLSEASSLHLKEVLEFIEALELPFRINNTLIANRNFCQDSIFEIRDLEEKVPGILALGARYSLLTRKVGSKRDIPAVTVSIRVPSRKTKEPSKKRVAELAFPEIALVQFGVEAKKQALKLMRVLHDERIPVEHNLTKDKLANQMSAVERSGLRYILLIGQKEAMERSVVIRESDSRSQDSVLIEKAVPFIKKKIQGK
jgi:histidyl-tRNA synthetase